MTFMEKSGDLFDVSQKYYREVVYNIQKSRKMKM